jgi:hypothetical protein
MRYFAAGLLLVGLLAVYACSKEEPRAAPSTSTHIQEQKTPEPSPPVADDDGIIWRDSEGRIIH